MNGNKIIVALSVAAGVATSLGAYLMVRPSASSAISTGTFYSALILNIFAFCLFVGAAVLFVTSLNVYKTELRRAFAPIVVGIVLQAVAVLQLTVINLLDAWGSVYVSGGFIGLPFLLYGFVTYLGAAAFGKLVGTKGLSVRRWAVLPLSAVVPLLIAFLPHVASVDNELSYDIANFILGWSSMLLVASAVIFLRTSKKIGTHYAYAMAWLGVALLASGGALAISVSDRLTTLVNDPLSTPINIATIVTGFIWLKAGHSLSKTKEY